MAIEQINDIKTVEFFKVLSHEIRVKIISLLYENIEMSYTEILHTLNLHVHRPPAVAPNETPEYFHTSSGLR